MKNSNRLNIFTWHIHGSYLYYLSQGDFNIYIPVKENKEEGYYGRGETFPFNDNVIEVESGDVRFLQLDCILFQTNANYLVDQYEILSEEQRKLPRIYLEHDPPLKQPADTRHIMNDPDVCLVHVTHYNKLMWDNGVPMVSVIEHGITSSPATYSGHLNKGIVVINHLYQRGRKLGADIYDEVRKQVPLDLIGMGTEAYGGLGEVLHPDIPAFIGQYRFFFNPIRYTSLGLSFLEAMMMGLPVVALATTEYSTVIENEKNGFVHTDIDYLVDKMKLLLDEPPLAEKIGLAGKQTVEQKYNINRFTKDWETLFHFVIDNTKSSNHEKKISIY
ncbi:glycosyltransferase family 4 protein [Danxiaibacter flavus]|uniref:Glycosyltransferase family 4 protein n=1 Tax=Danxiaibacter flavus TaxID=3049108 RepID=A0ABV3ZIS1_9BACT|nr:glycosyltransferase family 4 protein [Chitinophagaceae bacterium DXS]